jgi:hypothetical protein
MTAVGISKKSDIAFSIKVILPMAASNRTHKNCNSQILLLFMVVLKEPHPNNYMAAELSMGTIE